MTRPEAIIVPEETELTAPFWQGARAGELRLQRCSRCSVVLHPPQPICPGCHSSDSVGWFAASGQGCVYAITRVEHAVHPAVSESVPYAVLLIQLDEGPLLISAPPMTQKAPYPPVGSRVRVVFEALTETDVVLPKFVLVADINDGDRGVTGAD